MPELMVLDNSVDRTYYRPVEHWERVAGRRLDLDHLGAEIGQDPGAEGTGDVVAEFQHLEPHQGAGSRRRHGHGGRFPGWPTAKMAEHDGKDGWP